MSVTPDFPDLMQSHGILADLLYYKDAVGREGACPDETSIVRFLSGRLDSDARTLIEDHVDECAKCALVVVPSGPSPAARRTLDTQAFAAGDLVAGRYRIASLIGGGGMGEVYSALDEELRENVALKTVRAAVADDTRAIARLKTEVQLARRVTHPNVCRIYDHGIHPGVSAQGADLAFLTMELLPGKTLAEEIRAHGALPIETALVVARHLVAGLRAAHHAGVIHKDFKSDNVMLVSGTPRTSSAFERAVITDFGLAASEAPASRRTSSRIGFSGTPGYVAPERLRGAPATPASDIYSLGVVLFDMLEGRVPARPASITQARSKASSGELGRLALRCCYERPDARPSADELAASLARLETSGSGRWRYAAAAVGVAALLTVTSALTRRPAPPTPAPNFGQRTGGSEVERLPSPQMPNPIVVGERPPKTATRRVVPRREQVRVTPTHGDGDELVAAVELESAASSRERDVQSSDEPIRSLGSAARTTTTGAVALGSQDDAPINSLAEPLPIGRSAEPSRASLSGLEQARRDDHDPGSPSSNAAP